MTTENPDSGKRILLGQIVGAFGVRGQVKIESWTEPRTAIFRYQPWTLVDAQGRERGLSGVRGRETGKNLIADFPGIEDRDAVEALRGTEIFVPRSSLPPPKPGEYYWVDLEGLRVLNADGADYGVVSHLFSTGSNDVLVAKGDKERLIPFVEPDFVKSVDFDAGVVTVDWDADF